MAELMLSGWPALAPVLVAGTLALVVGNRRARVDEARGSRSRHPSTTPGSHPSLAAAGR